jgi:UDP-glucose 4-epimerase
MQRILVTGGRGYIGGRIVQYLAQTGAWQVTVGTRGGRFAGERPSEVNLAATDWGSESALREICRAVDFVIHLAGMNAAECAADPVSALAFNAVGTARLVAAAVAAGVKRFIYVSTAHVYASPLRGIITESSPLTNLHPYATSHRAAEDVVRFAHQRGGLEGIVVRLSNSFGAPADSEANCWTLLVNDLCRQAAEHEKLQLNTSGLQRRDFITLTDVSRGLDHLLRADVAAIADGLFNLGGAWAPTVIEMTERVASAAERIVGRRPRILRPQPAPEEQSHPLDFRIDKLLHTGFALVANVDAEIRSTLQFCYAAPEAHRVK